MKNLLLIGGAALVVYFFALKNTVSNLDVSFKKIKFYFNGIYPYTDIMLNIGNATNMGATITGASGVLSVGGVEIGTVSTFNQQTIRAHAVSEYILTVRLNPLSVVTDILDRINGGGGFQRQIDFSGVLNAEGVSFPINFNFTV